MLSRMLSLAAVPLVLVACGTTRELVDPPGGLASQEVIGQIQGRAATVTLRNGSEYEGDVVACGTDSIALVERSGGEVHRLPLASVSSIGVRESRVP